MSTLFINHPQIFATDINIYVRIMHYVIEWWIVENQSGCKYFLLQQNNGSFIINCCQRYVKYNPMFEIQIIVKASIQFFAWYYFMGRIRWWIDWRKIDWLLHQRNLFDKI